jgi:phospholipid/cholesterol/gamma-HCH transport system permease protein
MIVLAATCARHLARPRYEWSREFVIQSSFLLRRCALPFAFSAVFVSFAINMIAAGQAVKLLGAADRLGTFTGLSAMREFSFWVGGTMMAGVAGSAICADLASRRVREELDALSVLGVDINRALVLPRVLALTLMAPLLALWSDFFLILVPYLLGPPLFGITQASFVSSFQDVLVVDLYGHLIKLTICGAVIGVVCTYTGLRASGGPAGVARAVNQAVLVSFVSTWVIDLLFNTFLQGAFPSTQSVR